MLHSVASSFGSFFALRFLLGRISLDYFDPHIHDVFRHDGILRGTDPHLDYLDVLQEGRAGMLY